ncbi:hypothetical protein OS493_039951 [Desmophyllum pertusum]|uniref:Uncharacterized protein n=1 Tax=Desmophyllum pertusum TaxID=174260 RepID=A0A9X0D5G8_9CNID|nr:hypothetical protein OS493_039951 [Desmophyllum pertusum]
MPAATAQSLQPRGFTLETTEAQNIKKLQIPKMAVSTKLQQPLPTAPDRNSPTEQLDGTLVFDALLNAACFPVTQRLQEWFSNPLSGMIEGSREYNEGLIKRLHKDKGDVGIWPLSQCHQHSHAAQKVDNMCRWFPLLLTPHTHNTGCNGTYTPGSLPYSTPPGWSPDLPVYPPRPGYMGSVPGRIPPGTHEGQQVHSYSTRHSTGTSSYPPSRLLMAGYGREMPPPPPYPGHGAGYDSQRQHMTVAHAPWSASVPAVTTTAASESRQFVAGSTSFPASQPRTPVGQTVQDGVAK